LPDLSLIISVYNKPEILRLVLAACERQSFRRFEVIIGDDGSGPAVKEVAREAESSYDFPILHLWHEDRGWRKNTMLNNAIRASSAGYLAFIDGDCLPSRHFLRDHWENRQPQKTLLGRRMMMSRRWSEQLTVDRVLNGWYEKIGLRELMESFRGELSAFEDGIRISSPLIRNTLRRKARGMLGSNFSVAKEHLVAVNGFDELYDGPGCGEDTDIEYRLSLIGVTGVSIRNLAIQYHVYHPRTKTSQACWDRFHKVVKGSTEPRCSVGLIKESERKSVGQDSALG
jgi:cellulose synthase/poly-beta-1,6-N-acetylglucosamine synthase-like glycosyltransferase